jgi:hypothetical protein
LIEEGWCAMGLRTLCEESFFEEIDGIEEDLCDGFWRTEVWVVFDGFLKGGWCGFLGF